MKCKQKLEREVEVIYVEKFDEETIKELCDLCGESIEFWLDSDNYLVCRPNNCLSSIRTGDYVSKSEGSRFGNNINAVSKERFNNSYEIIGEKCVEEVMLPVGSKVIPKLPHGGNVTITINKERLK